MYTYIYMSVYSAILKGNFPVSLIQRIAVHLHFMEIWLTYFSALGWLPQIREASKPKDCCTCSLTAELQAAHRQYFYPWKLTASALHFHSAKFWCAVFLPLSRGLKAACVSCKQVPTPHPPTLPHTCTHTGCIWAKGAFWNHKRLSYHMIAFCMSHIWITWVQKTSLHPSHLGEVDQKPKHVTCAERKSVHEWV